MTLTQKRRTLVKRKALKGEEKTAWTSDGTALANDSGNITLDLPQHVAVSGLMVLFPKDDEAKDE